MKIVGLSRSELNAVRGRKELLGRLQYINNNNWLQGKAFYFRVSNIELRQAENEMILYGTIVVDDYLDINMMRIGTFSFDKFHKRIDLLIREQDYYKSLLA